METFPECYFSLTTSFFLDVVILSKSFYFSGLHKYLEQSIQVLKNFIVHALKILDVDKRQAILCAQNILSFAMSFVNASFGKTSLDGTTLEASSKAICESSV